LQRAFPLYISMVPSSGLTIAIDSDHLTYGGFSLSETILLGSFEFITDYFNGLSLSPRRGNSGPAFMGPTRSRTPSSRWAMIEDSTEEFLTVPSGEGGSDLPSHRRCNMGAPPTPVATTPWMKNAPATQAITMVPPQTVALQPDVSLPFEQRHTRQEG
jgi:hypothetical protein